MQKVKVYWHVCADVDGDWECIDSHHPRAEAEAKLRDVRSGGLWPKAFLVRLTMTRMDQRHVPLTLTLV